MGQVATALGVTPVPGKFLSETEVLRHDPERVGGAIIKLINDVLGSTVTGMTST